MQFRSVLATGPFRDWLLQRMIQHVNGLVEAGVYPLTAVMKQYGWDAYRMVLTHGARWHLCQGQVTTCAGCKADLRDHDMGPPFTRSIGVFNDSWPLEVCPECGWDVTRPEQSSVVTQGTKSEADARNELLRREELYAVMRGDILEFGKSLVYLADRYLQTGDVIEAFITYGRAISVFQGRREALDFLLQRVPLEARAAGYETERSWLQTEIARLLRLLDELDRPDDSSEPKPVQ